MADKIQLRMIGHLERPECLQSTTYRIRPPGQENSYYITISDHEVEGKRRPFEIFIATKEPESFQWISALMQLISSRLQEPGPFPYFIIDQLVEVHDTQGGYMTQEQFLRAGGRPPHAHGVVSHVGLVLRYHCKQLGIKAPPRKRSHTRT